MYVRDKYCFYGLCGFVAVRRGMLTLTLTLALTLTLTLRLNPTLTLTPTPNFYQVRRGKLRHLAFSCRLLGLEVRN